MALERGNLYPFGLYIRKFVTCDNPILQRLLIGKRIKLPISKNCPDIWHLGRVPTVAKSFTWRQVIISGSTRICEGGSRRSDQHNTELRAQFFWWRLRACGGENWYPIPENRDRGRLKCAIIEIFQLSPNILLLTTISSPKLLRPLLVFEHYFLKISAIRFLFMENICTYSPALL